MIFVTVGAQMPFDRLVRVVDEWARRVGRDDVFAQIGPSRQRPAHIRWKCFLTPAEFRQHVESARVLVTHAGVGSILTGLEFGKGILVMPRRQAMRETRNDHQVATAERFKARGIAVATDEHELARCLDRLDELIPVKPIAPCASAELIDTIRDFIAGATPSAHRLDRS